MKIKNKGLEVSFITKLFGKKEATKAGMTDDQRRQFQEMIAGHAARDLELKAAKDAMIQTPEDIARAAIDPLFRETRIRLAYTTNKQLLLGAGKSDSEADHFASLAAEKVANMLSK